MTLESIAEDIGTTTDEQTDDDHDRFHTGESSQELHDRQMDEYGGGWDADH